MNHFIHKFMWQMQDYQRGQRAAAATTTAG